MFEQMKRLAKHSAIYGLGGLLSRILAVLLLPLYTRYLSPRDYGAIETLVALTVVLMSVIRAGIASAFFRFYFDSPEEAYRTRVVRTSFWYTMVAATAALVVGLLLAAPIGHAFFGAHGHTNLIRAAFVGLWAQINYDQLTSLFRVEERSVSYALASFVNIAITIGLTILLVVAWHKGPIGVLVGNFSGTLIVYGVLLYYRRVPLRVRVDPRVFPPVEKIGGAVVSPFVARFCVGLFPPLLLRQRPR